MRRGYESVNKILFSERRYLDAKFPSRIISATSVVSICQEPRNFG